MACLFGIKEYEVKVTLKIDDGNKIMSVFLFIVFVMLSSWSVLIGYRLRNVFLLVVYYVIRIRLSI